MELRAHHLLCLPMYQGHGYSEAFCAHMEKVIERIRSTEEPIRPLAFPDEICIGCPHLQQSSGQNRSCDDEVKIFKKDSALLENFGLSCEREYSRDELKKTVLSHMTAEVFETSCGKCEWKRQGLCSYKMWKNNFENFF